MEDRATSPASSVSSGSSEIRGLSVGNEESATVPKPSFITPSESSAFSKIDRKNIQQFQFPNITPVNPFCPPLGVGYLPGMCLPPWSLESFPGGTTFPLPRGLSEGCQSSYTSKSDEENEDTAKMENVDKNAFYYVDTKIPFTNYFLNLTRIFQRGSTGKGNESENTDMKKEQEEENCEKRERADFISETEQTDRKEEKLYSQTRFESEMKATVSSENMNLSPRMYNAANSYSLPGQVIPNLPTPSLLQFMNSVNAPPSVFHPAFLHMNGVGMKRLPSDKPPPVKKYKCDVCGKAFSRSNTLVTHKSYL
ncbi:hypothetical protein KUTeg_000811 [Tegillarca granosa]|uniref:C2H2-type domain-containing protein n=1 Tax=Tegillarca granosa TaxID=220873 RepID=A0ABQ9FYN6_TEGGR|nr:hypothetical protein KUTeg_000811 [Tegillarca granosa]